MSWMKNKSKCNNLSYQLEAGIRSYAMDEVTLNSRRRQPTCPLLG